MRFGDAISALRGITGSALTSFANSVTGLKPGSSAFAEYVSTQPYFVPPNADTLTLIKLYNENLWVRTILHKIGHSVGQRRWFLKDEDDETEIDDHPALSFLRKGAPTLRGKRAMALTTTYVDLTGECFWIIGRDAKGVPVEYAPVPPSWMLDLPHLSQPNYRLQPRLGVIYDIPPEQVLHFREVNPLDPYGRGVGAAHAYKVEIDTYQQSATFLNKFFQNNARPDFIVSGTEKSPLSQGEARRMEAAWGEKFNWGRGRNGRGFFSSGEVKVQQVSNGLRENQVDKIAMQLKATISEAFGIPPEILGRLDSSNRATIDSADYLFAKHVVKPRLELLHDTIEPFLMDEFGIEECALAFENPVDEDVDKTLSVINVRPSAFSDDEIRELAGFVALGGKHGEVPEPIDPAALPPAGGPQGGTPGNEPPKGGEKPDAQGANEPAEPGAKALPAPESAAAEKAAEPVAEVRDVDVAPVSKSLTPQDIVSVSSVLDDPQVRAAASQIFDELFRKLLLTYGDELLSQLDAGGRFAINASVADWLAEHGSSLIGEIDETTRAALKAALVDGAALDEGLDALIARIDDVFTDAADWRAELIGQTEATALTGFGSLAAAKQGGFEEKQWLSTRDQLVRSSHAELDGKVRPVDGYFETADGQAQYPGGFGKASEDANCRCAIRPVLPGEDVADDERKALTRTNFAKWHETARERMVSSVRKKAQTVFAAQREVVVAQLKRSMGQHGV